MRRGCGKFWRKRDGEWNDIASSASRVEIEPQLVMERLVRSYIQRDASDAFTGGLRCQVMHGKCAGAAQESRYLCLRRVWRKDLTFYDRKFNVVWFD